MECNNITVYAYLKYRRFERHYQPIYIDVCVFSRIPKIVNIYIMYLCVFVWILENARGPYERVGWKLRIIIVGVGPMRDGVEAVL